jgi:hypothetical protein
MFKKCLSVLQEKSGRARKKRKVWNMKYMKTLAEHERNMNKT